MLHFDITSGCTVSSLCESLIDLGIPVEILNSILSNKIKLTKKKITFPKLNPICKTIKELDFFNSLNLPGNVSTLYNKVNKLLINANYKISTEDIFGALSFFILLDKLNPLIITLSRIPLSFPLNDIKKEITLKLCEFYPIIENEWPAPSCSIVALAILKTITSGFGPQDKSTLIKIGTGVSVKTIAMLSENNNFVSILAKRNNTKISYSQLCSLTKLYVTLPCATTYITLIGELRKKQNIKVSAVQNYDLYNNTGTEFSLNIITPSEHENEIYKTIFQIAGFVNIEKSNIEYIKPNTRVAAILFGTTKKKYICRITEYSLSGKILCAHPIQEDLDVITEETGLAQEIIKNSVLLKWNQCNNS